MHSCNFVNPYYENTIVVFSNSDTCPQEYTATMGRIRSPGYPGYRNNVHCVIIVRLNNTIGNERRLRLDVDDFNLEDTYDYLVIGSTKLSALETGRSYTGADRLLTIQLVQSCNYGMQLY